MRPAVVAIGALAGMLFAGAGPDALPAQELDVHVTGETGGVYAEDTSFYSDTLGEARLTWIFSPDADLEVRGGYGYRYDEAATDPEGELRPVLDRARYAVRLPVSDTAGTVFELRAGRFGFEDATGMVVDTPADGLSIGVVGPTVTARVQSAYTGLLFRDSTDVRLTAADALDTDNVLGPAHLLGRVELAFPELLSRQSIILDAVGHLDLPELPGSDIESPDRLDGVYGSATLTGPLSPRVFYTIYGLAHAGRYFADREQDGETYALFGTAAGGSVRAFAPALGRSRLELSAGYASGEDGFTRFSPTARGTATFFAPITPAEPWRFAPLRFANVLYGSLDYSVQPVDIGAGPREGLRTALSVSAAYRPARGAGTLVGLPDDAETGYVGTEFGATIDIRPVSDLRFALDGDIFLPSEMLSNSGFVPDTDMRGRVRARVELSL